VEFYEEQWQTSRMEELVEDAASERVDASSDGKVVDAKMDWKKTDD